MPNPENIIGKGFKPGQSGNPKGRPKGIRTLSTELKKILEVHIDTTNERGRPVKAKINKVLAMALVKAALKGNVRAFKEIADRTEGTVVQKMEHAGVDGAPLAPTSITFIGVEPEKPNE